VPEYLKSALPSMKYEKVKAKFKEMNKFCPPEITYFEKMIATTRSSNRKSIRSHRDHLALQKKRDIEVHHLREELQYALIMTNRNSNILVDMVEKVAKAEKKLKPRAKPIHAESSFEQKLMKTKKSQSLELGKHKECFANTVDIVFSLKRKEFIHKLRQTPEPEPRESVSSRINGIRLRTFNPE
jgi:signal recognition particle GTPase